MSIVHIVFENKDFVICDKPACVLSTPDRFKTDRPCLGLELQKQLQIQIFPVHRLDFEVSGLIIYAKNAEAHKASQDWFVKKIISKTYEALTLEQNFDHWPQNIPAARELIHFESQKSFEWQMKIMRGKKRSFESAHGDLALTVAKMSSTVSLSLREKNRKLICWRLQPITGRAHQLRLELSRHGFPILNDTLYGGVSLEGTSDLSLLWTHGGIALRAIEIQIAPKEAQRFNMPEKISIDSMR